MSSSNFASQSLKCASVATQKRLIIGHRCQRGVEGQSLERYGDFHKWGTPNGWFIMKKPSINGWFVGTHILGNPYMDVSSSELNLNHRKRGFPSGCHGNADTGGYFHFGVWSFWPVGDLGIFLMFINKPVSFHVFKMVVIQTQNKQQKLYNPGRCLLIVSHSSICLQNHVQNHTLHRFLSALGWTWRLEAAIKKTDECGGFNMTSACCLKIPSGHLT
jgi:hypothetical protein